MRETKSKLKEDSEKQFDLTFHSRKKLSTNSNRMVEERREEQLRSLFHLLDSDGDGTVTSSQVDLSQLSTKVLDILTPFLLKMEQESSIFTEGSFVKEATLFFKNLSFLEKEELYGASKKVQDLNKEKFKFTPQLSEKSLKIAKKKSQQRGRLQSDPIHHFLIKEAKQINEKKEKENSKPEEDGSQLLD
mmetsp:Transcript_38561/g.36914  ORF Transcript_38561/g.36914 Transcript_38561/m.36914 type:complete len:189 (+) Transcript_38561:1061-1627(+)